MIAAIGLALCADQALAQQRCPEARPGPNCCDWQLQLVANQENWATVPLPLPPAEIKEIRGPGLRSSAQVYQVCVVQVQGQAGERFIETALEPPTRVDPPTIVATTELRAGRCHILVASTMVLHYTNPDRQRRRITGRTCLLGPYRNRP
jgi:hypothetical protein